MAREIEYDDSNLQQLFAELEPKRRVQALRGGYRRMANRVRKVAIEHLRSSIRSDRDLEKGIRTIVFKKVVGFRLTVGTKFGKNGKGEAGFHNNRQGMKKPVLIWAEDGTDSRNTKHGRRAAHFTGYMRAYGFMHATARETRGTITEEMRENLVKSITQTAKRYGGK